MTNRETVEDWTAAYRAAWESNEPDDIRALFTEGAVYRGRPASPPWTGHDAIVAGWLEHADEPGSTDFSWEVLAVDDDLGVVRGVSTYPSGPKSGVYDNLWVVRFAADGRAEEFTDWWIERPERGPVPV